MSISIADRIIDRVHTDIRSMTIAKNKKKRPAALIAVATIFIVFGVYSIADMLILYLQGKFALQSGPLSIFVGIGLLRLSRRWRTVALLILWIGLAFGVAARLMLLTSMLGLTSIRIFSATEPNQNPMLLLLIVSGTLALTIWQYHILTRNDVRALFGVVRKA